MSDIESEDELQSQVLPVAECSRLALDVNEPPTTGEEYLARVRREALRLPKVVTVNLPSNKSTISTQINELIVDTNHEIPIEFKANLDWQRRTCADFARLRIDIEKNRESNEITMTNIKFDSKKEWYKFFFDENTKHEPLLSILYTFDQPTILKLFDYHVEWFQEKDVSESEHAFKWLFSLMSFIEKPLLPETYSMLRQLARRCLQLRSNIVQHKQENDSKDLLISLNLLITLVARYFEQYDLADA